MQTPMPPSPAPQPPTSTPPPPPPSSAPVKKPENEFHIERILTPYVHLNPLAVLDLYRNPSEDEIRRQFRMLSRLVHPDKNPANLANAQRAFEIVNKAHKDLLEDEEELKFCREAMEESVRRVNEDIKTAKLDYKRRMNYRKGTGTKLVYPPEMLTEDDSERYKAAVRHMSIRVYNTLSLTKYRKANANPSGFCRTR